VRVRDRAFSPALRSAAGRRLGLDDGTLAITSVGRLHRHERNDRTRLGRLAWRLEVDAGVSLGGAVPRDAVAGARGSVTPAC
jgi:hypothetical protein